MHNGPLSRSQRWRVARIHGGPWAILTAFTAAEAYGITGWEREGAHLLVPGGTRLRGACPVPVVHHRHGTGTIRQNARKGVEYLPDALIRAGATFTGPRPACGLLAASVQQRKVDPNELTRALRQAPRTRHRAVLLAAVADIAGGSEALSEIDFVRLCRRHRLPEPIRQRVRREPSGQRRYVDASWRRKDGRLVVAEVDGALHLVARRWWEDQLRQNELALADALVLRFLSVVIRTEEQLVADQLRRALRVN
ncbi:MAG: hypothetical protein JWO57_3627 [Pseudonocardiales bacterium]|nr:hypothetical protein [Pseudonocardiales bacterium]